VSVTWFSQRIMSGVGLPYRGSALRSSVGPLNRQTSRDERATRRWKKRFKARTSSSTSIWCCCANPPLPETIIRIRILPVMGEQSGMAEKSVVFCDNPLGPSASVWAAPIGIGPSAEQPQITQPRVRIQAR
jgi:hypothetical protein